MKGAVTQANRDIVNKLAKDGVVHQLLMRITKDGTAEKDAESIADLEQDIYLSLLENANLEQIYNDGPNNIRWYIIRMITNNLMSTTSRYYMQYIRPILLKDKINDKTFTDYER